MRPTIAEKYHSKYSKETETDAVSIEIFGLMQVDWLYLDSVAEFIKKVQPSVNGKIRKQRRANSQGVPFFTILLLIKALIFAP